VDARQTGAAVTESPEDAEPTAGRARRGRVGCLAALVGAAVALLSAIVAVLVFGPDDDAGTRADDPCDLLEIQLAYLEGATVGESEPAADALTEAQLAAEVARVRRNLDELGC